MTTCLNCGREIKGAVGRNCPYCGTQLKIGNITSKPIYSKYKHNYDSYSNKIIMASIIISTYGLLMYYGNKNSNPIKSKCALEGLRIGLFFKLLVIGIIILVKILKKT